MTWKGRDLDLVTIGDPVVTLAAAEHLADATSYTRQMQGEAVVAALTAASRGLDVALVTRVGEDVFTDWLLETWDRAGLHLDFARRVAGRNGLALTGVLPNGRQELLVRDGSAAAGMDPSDVGDVPWEVVRWVYAAGETQALSGGARRAVLAAFEQARERGARTAYDPTLRPELWPADPDGKLATAAFDEVAELVDVLFIGAPYATGKLLRQPVAEEAAREALRRGMSGVVVRDGRGCIVGDREGVCRLTGATTADPAEGAPFNAEVLVALARGASLRDAVTQALG